MIDKQVWDRFEEGKVASSALQKAHPYINTSANGDQSPEAMEKYELHLYAAQTWGSLIWLRDNLKMCEGRLITAHTVLQDLIDNCPGVKEYLVARIEAGSAVQQVSQHLTEDTFRVRY